MAPALQQGVLRDWRRIRLWIVCALCALILLVAGFTAESLCQSVGELSIRGNSSRWTRLVGAAGFFCLGFGPIAHDILSLIFVRLGREPEFRPVAICIPDAGTEFSRRERWLVAYPMDAAFALAGLWLWVSTLGCVTA